ncbi:hypothetical protein ACF07E_35795, partial [Streptomyces sp. NPDC015680]
MTTPLPRSSGAVRAAGAALVAVALAASTAPAASATTTARDSSGQVQYVDCGAASGKESGSRNQPWRTLDQVNRLNLKTGSSILLKRGSRCTGTLAPQGTGQRGKPMMIGAYGRGAKPVIDGDGNPETLLLKNTQWVEAKDLEITNSGNPGRNKRGVRVQLQDFGTGTHYRLTGLDIHDIRGDDTKGTEGSAGI